MRKCILAGSYRRSLTLFNRMKLTVRAVILRSATALAMALSPLLAHAIVGGVNSVDHVPAYMTEADRAAMKSHTVVFLNAQNSSSHSRCSGTLLAKNVVLTAAHCVPESINELYIVASAYEFDVLKQRPVTKIRVHENYKPSQIFNQTGPNYDLALVKFAGELPVDYVPTSWINKFSPTMARFWLFVAGYGVSDQMKQDSGEIRFGRVTIENAMANANSSYLVGNQNSGEGICKGDSGGPAYLKIKQAFFVIGIVSLFEGGCKGQSYLNQTLFYSDWIQKNLAILS